MLALVGMQAVLTVLVWAVTACLTAATEAWARLRPRKVLLTPDPVQARLDAARVLRHVLMSSQWHGFASGLRGPPAA